MAVELSIRNLLYVMLAATAISLVLLPYPLMALIVMVTVGQVLFGVMGYAILWGLSLNVPTMLSLILAVGFSVDNAAHFCHSFVTAPLKTDGVTIFIRDGKTMEYSPTNERKARVLYTLNAMGLPIIAGNLTTFIGMLPLATANSQIVISIFKVLSLVMLFGMSHSIIYLPVLLSLIGPLGYKKPNIAHNESSTATPGSRSIPSFEPHHPVKSATATVSVHHVDALMKEVAVDHEEEKLHTSRARSLEIIAQVRLSCSHDQLK